jgi:CO dehydrogenase/acetyl-CoA synthase beta subunit
MSESKGRIESARLLFDESVFDFCIMFSFVCLAQHFAPSVVCMAQARATLPTYPSLCRHILIF